MSLLERAAHVRRLGSHKRINAPVWRRMSSLFRRCKLKSMLLPLSNQPFVCKCLLGAHTHQGSSNTCRSDCACRLPEEGRVPRLYTPSLQFLLACTRLWGHVRHVSPREAVKFAGDILNSLLMVAGWERLTIVSISLNLNRVTEHVKIFAEVLTHFICIYN